MTQKFIADVHLGKLARLLRLLGFDSTYRNDHSPNELLQLGQEENRMLLSRNSSFEKNMGVNSLTIKSEYPLQQLRQVIDHFNLRNQFHPFSRCIVCNGILEPVAKESILPLLEKNTAQYFNEFWRCNQCEKIYWKGSHYERMLKTITDIIS
jgi:uncharacterized protein with PIN domain